MLDDEPIDGSGVAHLVAPRKASRVENLADGTLVDAVDTLHLSDKRIDERLVARLGIVGSKEFISHFLVATPNLLQAVLQRLIEGCLNPVTPGNNGVAISFPPYVAVQVLKVAVVVGVVDSPVAVAHQPHVQSLESYIAESCHRGRTGAVVEMCALNLSLHPEGVSKRVTGTHIVSSHEA